jgi:hypothetical protein
MQIGDLGNQHRGTGGGEVIEASGAGP